MDKVSYIWAIGHIIPQIFLMLCSIHVIAQKKIDIKRFAISLVILIVEYLFLEYINLRVSIDVLSGMFLLVVLSIFINRIDIIKAIFGVILSLIIFILSSRINNILIKVTLGASISQLFRYPSLRVVLFIPVLFIYLIITCVIDKLLAKKHGHSHGIII